MKLNEDDLKELGVVKMRPRKLMLLDLARHTAA